MSISHGAAAFDAYGSHAVAQAEPVAPAPMTSNKWIAETVFAFLSQALPHYAATSSFVGALDAAPDFALRPGPKRSIAFRHFDARMSGTIEPKKAKIKIAGASAAQVMRDVVARYCTDPGGEPQRAQIASGARMVHIAAVRMSGDRLVRHACYDSVMMDRKSGERVPAATLLLRPLAPPMLVLRNPVSVPA